MNYTVRAFNTGTFWVPGPEVYWMHNWGTREEMNIIIFLIQGGGKNILINTGAPQDLSELNAAWTGFFGFPKLLSSARKIRNLKMFLPDSGFNPATFPPSS